MATGGQLVPFDQPPTPVERLTAQFYAWEARGRGWQLWPYPVELEPPFVPFLFHYVQPGPRLDDARKPTWISALIERLRGGGPPALQAEPATLLVEPDFLEPEPEPLDDTSPVIELQLSVPPTLKIAPDATEQFLLSLAHCVSPVGFELVGTAEAVTVQLACREEDWPQVREQLGAHFPEAVMTEEADFLATRWARADQSEAVVVDFGLSHEFMRPLRTFRSFEPDPLISPTAALADLGEGETGVLQVLFERTRYPWAESALRAVTDAEGHAFFADAPEMVALVRTKVARPLFATVVRVAGRSPRSGRGWAIARALGASLAQFSDPMSNELIPLADEGYAAFEHTEDLLRRRSHRSGMLLNSEELLSLVHPPSASVRIAKLKRETKKTKAAPAVAVGHNLVLGENAHAGQRTTVSLSTEQRVQHMHVIGASGTGKSTLLLNLIVQDIEAGSGVAVLDPHGDLIDQILGYVPEERTDDVVLLDPADEEYPVGFNILSAHTALEKNLLASDLVAVFRRLSTTWGDQMTSVLGNAVLAFLESDEGGTLADLRRFLVEPEFRRRFLQTVRDPEVVYYWEKEFSLLSGKPQAPVLTRLDTFLRPKPIRFMVTQRENRLDLGRIMNEGKIFLAKLAQGLIGEENAYLLGSLLVSKLHLLAMSRQELAQAERRPFYIVIDEFQNFVTPSMAAILASARKYRLGLVLAHQDLRQVSKDPDVLSAVLSNPYTRVCFRVGDPDAKRLEDGFSYFEAKDLLNLGLGEAICRVERADYDFNLRTLPLPAVERSLAERRRDRIVAHSRSRYGTPRPPLEAPLPTEAALAPQPAPPRRPKAEAAAVPHERPGPPASVATVPAREAAPTGRGSRQHRYMQQLVKRWAESKGWRVAVEQPILGGLGAVDVALEKAGQRVACEISVTTPAEHEAGNAQKCLAAGYEHVLMVSADRKTLRGIAAAVENAVDEASRARVRCQTPEELFAFLDELDATAAGSEQTVRGYKVKVQYKSVDQGTTETKRQAISRVILKALGRLKGR